MIEKTIQDLTEAVKALNETLKLATASLVLTPKAPSGVGGAEAEKLKAAVTPKVQPEAEATTVEVVEDPKPAKVVTIEDVRAVGNKLVKENKREAMLAAIKAAGAEKLSEVKPEKFPELLEAFNKALAS